MITTRPATAADALALDALLAAGIDAGDVANLSAGDRAMWRRYVRDNPGETIVAERDGHLAGAITPYWETLVVAAPDRRRGVGRALVEAALATGEALVLAPPPDSPTATAFLTACGFTNDHVVALLRLAAATDLPAAAPAPGWVIRPYVVAEVRGYVALLNRVFSDLVHPLQFDEDDVVRAHARPDYDPSLVAVLVPAADPTALRGFCRVVTATNDAGMLEGEISILGVDREARGVGNGRALLRWGVHRLRELGCGGIVLSVIEADTAAHRLYLAEGFEPLSRTARWRRHHHPETPQ